MVFGEPAPLSKGVDLMKRHPFLGMASCALLLAAASTSPAWAAPELRFYGLVDVWAGSQRLPGQHSEGLISDGGMSTSYLGVSASDEFATGYKGVVQLEGFFRPTDGKWGRFDGDLTLARNANAGIESPYGTLRIGRVTSPLFVSTILFNPFVDSYVFSPIIAHTYLGMGTYPPYETDQGLIGDSGWSHALQYDSPDMHGITVNVTYGASDSSEHNSARKVGGRVMYASGAFAATAGYQYLSYNSSAGDLDQLVPGMTNQSTGLLGASYDFKVAKLFAQYLYTNNHRNGGNWKVNTSQLGVSVPIGKGSALASYAYSRDSGGMHQTRNTWSLGYDYPFNKYIDAYVAYMRDEISDLSGGSTVGAGLRLSF
jgi:predicted porin